MLMNCGRKPETELLLLLMLKAFLGFANSGNATIST